MAIGAPLRGEDPERLGTRHYSLANAFMAGSSRNVLHNDHSWEDV